VQRNTSPFDHLTDENLQHQRYGNADRPGGLQVDGKIELGQHVRRTLALRMRLAPLASMRKILSTLLSTKAQTDIDRDANPRRSGFSFEI
jgi:hypothetical protein